MKKTALNSPLRSANTIEDKFNKAFCLLNSKDLKESHTNYYFLFESSQLYYRKKKFNHLANTDKDYRQAIKLFSNIIDHNPDHEISYNYRAMAKYRLLDYLGSIEDLNKAIELDPFYSNAYNNKGNVLASLKNFNAAIEYFDKAIELDPNSAIVYNNRANAKKNIKDRTGATDDYTKAIEIEPNYGMHNKTRV